MARRLRIEYLGAIHHVINRGNYRRELAGESGRQPSEIRKVDFRTEGQAVQEAMESSRQGESDKSRERPIG